MRDVGDAGAIIEQLIMLQVVERLRREAPAANADVRRARCRRRPTTIWPRGCNLASSPGGARSVRSPSTSSTSAFRGGAVRNAGAVPAKSNHRRHARRSGASPLAQTAPSSSDAADASSGCAIGKGQRSAVARAGFKFSKSDKRIELEQSALGFGDVRRQATSACCRCRR